MYSVDYVRPGTPVDGESLYAAFGAAIHHGVATLRPVTADPFLADSLGVEEGAPLLELRQVDYDEAEEAIAAARSTTSPTRSTSRSTGGGRREGHWCSASTSARRGPARS